MSNLPASAARASFVVPAGLALWGLTSFVGLIIHPTDFRIIAVALPVFIAIVYAYASVLFKPAIVVAVALIALIPIYWVPPPNGLVPFTMVPAAFAAILLAPVAIRKIGLGNVVLLDWIILLLVGSGIVSNYLNYDYSFNLSVNLVIRVGLLYLTFRIIARTDSLLRVVTLTTYTVGVLLAIAAVYERVNEQNIFLEIATPGYQAEQWAELFIRFGEVRSATSFGHPIPLGLFFAVCAILGAALYATTSGKARFVVLATEVVLVAGLWATLTRGPLAVAAGGYLLYLIGTREAQRARQLCTAAALGILVYFFTPFGEQISNLWTNTFGQSTDRLTGSSTDYRGSLFDAFGYSQNYSAFGISRGNLFDQTSAVGVRGSVDNEYLLRLLQYGTTGLLLFIGIVFAVIAIAVRESDPIRRAWAVSTAAVAICLSTVALLLQQTDFFWIGVAIVAAGQAAAKDRLVGRSRTAATLVTSQVTNAVPHTRYNSPLLSTMGARGRRLTLARQRTKTDVARS